jgi:multidrug efflux pump subunit AcrB
MGLILLIGLVVKNGIILVDYAGIAAARGASPLEALVEAGAVRLRPILMTTLCTLFGLLPLALGLGSGAELQKPLAIAVIGGLSVSTLVTLVFVPTILAQLYRGRADEAPRPAGG